MTIKNVSATPQSLRVIVRISLALLAMMLAERAADVCHGEPGSGTVTADTSESTTFGRASSQPRYTSSPSVSETAAESQERIREGTIVTDLIGQFKVAGDLATFTVNDSGQRFGGLENLNLARITNIIRDDPTADWSISGLVTEFRGSNYILIQKAIRKTNTGVSHSIKRKSAPALTESTEDQGNE